ncbi:hypothetical protein PMIN03_003798 [Paraphaeosphaeria minitans]|uniref:Uncharacterized protein n=1 Tax=Paraphaeosphaeria minitans TaxID=565426 RepID=A0A9P6KRR1_9PLEO|nr:hypothetical protein PMIN01_06006 [Paraphaeosphaeria minitans]
MIDVAILAQLGSANDLNANCFFATSPHALFNIMNMDTKNWNSFYGGKASPVICMISTPRLEQALPLETVVPIARETGRSRRKTDSKDAYLEFGGVEDDERGVLWGLQSLDWKKWGRKRLYKQVPWEDVAVGSLRKMGSA